MVSPLRRPQQCQVMQRCYVDCTINKITRGKHKQMHSTVQITRLIQGHETRLLTVVNSVFEQLQLMSRQCQLRPVCVLLLQILTSTHRHKFYYQLLSRSLIVTTSTGDEQWWTSSTLRQFCVHLTDHDWQDASLSIARSTLNSESSCLTCAVISYHRKGTHLAYLPQHVTIDASVAK